MKVPNLEGTWQGHIKSSFDKHVTQYNAILTIKQTWSRIGITLETDRSRSHSLIGGILCDDKHEAVITYEYLNEPKAEAERKMQAHRGAAWLTLQNDGRTLEGEYYSGRGRQNFGSLRFMRS